MERNSFIIKYKELPLLLAALLATSYIIIGGIFINGGIQILCFLGILLSSALSYKFKYVNYNDIWWMISLIPFIYSIQEWNVSAIRDFVAYLSFVVFVVCVKCEDRYLNKTVKFIYAMAIFNLIFVFINVIFNSQFTAFMYLILDQSAISTYDIAINGGYYSGLGYIPGDTSGYLVNGVLILLFGSFVLNRKNSIIRTIPLMIGIFYCAKKSHLLCLILTIMITWVIAARGSKRVKRIILAVIGLLVLLSLFYIVSPFLSGIPMIQRFTVAIDHLLSGSDYTSNRVNLSNRAIQMFNENKLLGAGWKSFNRLTMSRWGRTNYVNNVFVQLFAETGIIGGILFTTPIVLCLFRTLKKISILRKLAGKLDSSSINWMTLSLAFQVFFILYCFFEIPFYDYTFLFIYAIAIAISNSAYSQV